MVISRAVQFSWWFMLDPRPFISCRVLAKITRVFMEGLEISTGPDDMAVDFILWWIHLWITTEPLGGLIRFITHYQTVVHKRKSEIVEYRQAKYYQYSRELITVTSVHWIQRLWRIVGLQIWPSTSDFIHLSHLWCFTKPSWRTNVSLYWCLFEFPTVNRPFCWITWFRTSS